MSDEVSILQGPTPVMDRSVSAELVDFNAEIFQYLRGIEDTSEVMSVLAFDYREPLLIPSSGDFGGQGSRMGRGFSSTRPTRCLLHLARKKKVW